MTMRFALRTFHVIVGLVGVVVGGQALAQNTTVQTLDRTNVFNKTTVLETEFGDPARTVDFTVLGITAVTGFSACQITATRGLFCLDGTAVRNWPDPDSATGNGALLFSCTDTTLGFNPCSAMTVDQAGAVWLAGKKGNSYNLVKVFKKSGANCSPATALVQSPTYCAQTSVTGRPEINDVVSLDGDAAAASNLGAGTLAIETANTLVFYANVANVAPKILGTKQSLGLSGNEKLASATYLQIKIANVMRNFGLVSTSTGRIIATDTAAATLSSFVVFNAPTERTGSTTPATQCTTVEQRYAIRASTKSGRVYLTDRDFCQALSLEPAAATGQPFKLVNTQEDGQDLTFQTASYPPDGPTVAPGIVIDLSTCAVNCALLSDANGAPAATLSGVSLVGNATDMVLFQIKNITDCRWIDPKPAVCVPGVIVNPSDPPNAQYLNITPMLPNDIKLLFDSSGVPPGGLPAILISPQYRGQGQNGFIFEAFFGVPQTGLQFNQVFNGEFDITKLAGASLGCVTDPAEALKPNRKFDVVTTVSERYITAGGPGSITNSSNPNRYVDTITNTGCGTTKIASGRWSFYPYNLEVAPNTDAVFAKLLVKLYDDLETTRAELACKQVDTTGAPPLAASTCNTLRSQWLNGKDKLDKCIGASTQPKQSSGSQNCSAFDSQLTSYLGTIRAATASGPDPANRVNEVEARTVVVFSVFKDRFLPSIPVNGFTNL